MTREQVELICKNVRELGNLGWEADKLQMNDAEQRQIIDEQVEENRGLRADVLLMQKANAEQREEIRLLEEKLKGLCCAHGNALMQIHDKDKEITRLKSELDETWVDENQPAWTRPTAWAYAQVCKARDKWQADSIWQSERHQQYIAASQEEIERLRGELSHWTFVRFKELEAENEQLRESLQGIIDIGKRDMTNPKYDGYFEAAKKALTQEPT